MWSSDVFEVAYVANTRALKDKTERCPKCFFEGGPLVRELWWEGWETGLNGQRFGVYDIRDEERRICQIGSGIIKSRVRSRLKATYAGRFGHADSIWWLYDMLRGKRLPTLAVVPVKDGEPLAEAESRWREKRRRAGWQVSSNV